jgi:hypothetical protein
MVSIARREAFRSHSSSSTPLGVSRPFSISAIAKTDRGPNKGGKFVLSRAQGAPCFFGDDPWNFFGDRARTRASRRFVQDVFHRHFSLLLRAAGKTASASRRGGAEAGCGARILPHEGDLRHALWISTSADGRASVT